MLSTADGEKTHRRRLVRDFGLAGAVRLARAQEPALRAVRTMILVAGMLPSSAVVPVSCREGSFLLCRCCDGPRGATDYGRVNCFAPHKSCILGPLVYQQGCGTTACVLAIAGRFGCRRSASLDLGLRPRYG